MKKLISILIVLVMGLGTISLSSCDDEMTAYTLEGTWRGDMYTGYYYDGVEYWSSETELEFLTDPLSNTSGYGYWIDYYNDPHSPYSYYYSHINWQVRYGVIYIQFVDEPGYYNEIAIKDYGLRNDHFYGIIPYSDGTYDSFDLVHISSPHWGRYDYGWRTRAVGPDGTTRAADSAEKPVRIMRHTAK
jgi:hypothetical protein